MRPPFYPTSTTSVPILAKFSSNTTDKVNPFVYGGIAPAIKTSASLKANPDEVWEGEGFDDLIKTFDLGLVLGGGVRIGRLALECRYNLGLTPVNDGDVFKHDVKNGQFALLGSFFFSGR